jgi:hypothetical protein
MKNTLHRVLTGKYLSDILEYSKEETYRIGFNARIRD